MGGGSEPLGQPPSGLKEVDSFWEGAGLPRTCGHRSGVLTWRGGHLQSHADQDQHCTEMGPPLDGVGEDSG